METNKIQWGDSMIVLVGQLYYKTSVNLIIVDDYSTFLISKEGEHVESAYLLASRERVFARHTERATTMPSSPWGDILPPLLREA